MQKLSETSENPFLFDRSIIRQNRERAARLEWEKHGFLFKEISDRLAERLLDIDRKFETALDLGCHDGGFGRQLQQMDRIDTLISADLDPTLMTLGGVNTAVVADEEHLPFAQKSFDFIGSVLSLHWANDLPGALIQLTQCLKPDGLFVGAIFGIGTLQELKWCLMQAEEEVKGGVSPRISPFTEVRDAGGLLQRAGLALPVTDVDTLTLKYRSLFDLMKELRGMGETNALISRPKKFTGRRIMIRAAELYAENFADEEGLIPATFQIIYLTGWAPHESQQLPSKRGSGKTSLSEILS